MENSKYVLLFLKDMETFFKPFIIIIIIILLKDNKRKS